MTKVIKKNISSGKKRDNAGGLDCNEPNRTERGNDGCGVGTTTMAAGASRVI